MIVLVKRIKCYEMFCLKMKENVNSPHSFLMTSQGRIQDFLLGTNSFGGVDV